MEWSSFYSEMVDRNIGIVSKKEQEIIRKSCIAVAGCGGMGGLAALQSVRMGFGAIKIADFDVFEIHNISRQACASSCTAKQHKSDVIGKYIQEINPEISLEIFAEGVQEDNVEEFVEGADIIIDAIDYTCFYNSVLLHRRARTLNKCVIVPQAVGFGASVLVFSPETVDIESYVGLNKDSSEKTIMEFAIPIEKFAPHLPSYINPEITKQVEKGEIAIPNIIMEQHLGTAIALNEAVLMLLNRIEKPKGPGPKIICLDLQDKVFKTSHHC